MGSGDRAKVAFVSAIIGNYERTCKPIPEQTIPVDAIMYTNRTDMQAGAGWSLRNAVLHEASFVTDSKQLGYRNAASRHDFNVAKWYKLNLHRVHELQDYEYVMWCDGSLLINKPTVAARCRELMAQHKFDVLLFDHWRRGSIVAETQDSHQPKYMDPNWLGQAQPVQDVDSQLRAYLSEGLPHTPGVWMTGFFMVNMRSPRTAEMLDAWWNECLLHTTQDQISFPYVVWKHGLKVGTLQTLGVQVPDVYRHMGHGQ